jgi:peptidoglycan hydrolase CwlO-like protein
MPKVILKQTPLSEYKYSHAYDDFENLVSREKAINDGRDYYFDIEKQIKLKTKTSSLGNLFWSAYPNQKYTLRNVSYDFAELEKTFESYEHRKFKGDIIENLKFKYKGFDVLLQNAQEEIIIVDSYFRSDVKAQLLCGTDCIVEVIKSSDISKNKAQFIEDNQILTFKIYIDDKGNQKSERDSIIGDREIENINRRIQDGQGKLAEQKDELEQLDKIGKKKAFTEISRFEGWVQSRIRIFEDRNRELKQRKAELLGTEIDRRDGIRERITEFSNRIESTRREIEYEQERVNSFESGSKRTTECVSKIPELESRITEINNKFREIAKDCKIEWFRNKWMQGKCIDKLTEIKYWTS